MRRSQKKCVKRWGHRQMLNCWVDGSVTGGPWGSKKGPETIPANHIGWVVRSDVGQWIAHHSCDMGQREWYTGNTAEQFAVNSLLRWLVKNNYTDHHIVVHSDSKLTCGHISGAFNVYQPTLERLVKLNRQLIGQFKAGVAMRWVPRSNNVEADWLSKCLQPKYGAPGIPAGEIPAEVLLKHR